MTRVELINLTLSAIARLPIPLDANIEDIDITEPARLADTYLKMYNRELQQRGWWFNQRSLVLLPDLQGRITLPENIISFESDSYFKEGGDLRDSTTYLSNFTQPVTLDCTIEVAIGDVPERFRSYVINRASIHLAETLTSDSNMVKSLQEKLYNDYSELDREDTLRAKVNIATGRLTDNSTNPAIGG